MSIFDDIPRTSVAPPAGETQFAYLNLSARPEAGRVREKVDAWFDGYPEKNRDELIARFRSAIDDQHHSAFFEVFLYHLLLARGCKVLEIEPTLPHTTKSPDFLAENAAQEKFYLEAVQANGLSGQDVAARARLSMALVAIDGTTSPLHFLDLTVSGGPSEPLSTKKLVTALRSWIASLPADETAKDVPPFVWEENGAKIELRAWTSSKPDPVGRAIGISRTPVMRIEPSQDIRPALKKKASRYGKLEHAYLVALNGLSTHHSEEAVIDALLGTPVARISRGPNGEEIVEELRQPDGIWYGPPDGQPQNTRLSGVLALKRIDPWNFCSKTGLLIPNPWAAKLLPKLGLGTAEFVLKGNQYERVEGQPMHALVGLPAVWPEE
ncbi:hypothetical protein [Bradyrhizobium zhanjiangense]|uniref:Uncharacterized protein n=1 Tax=Bradyrhizobium zhanjiangense TaxID=1325107 RepID=A0A4Q0Q9P4_9BRAD|nr:hypothetical protein [Bradyrhizobium zhanjiangense]RXG85690.1 hypothetical protein EAS61_35515 [Bradyrhizobium zhanjiangense]